MSRVIPADWTAKLLIIGSLLLAQLLAFRALPAGGAVARAASSALYVANPFVFGRLHYGQVFLLAGYSLLPWLAIELRRITVEPRVSVGVRLGAAFAAVAAFTLHLALAGALLGFVVVAVHLAWFRAGWREVQRFLAALLGGSVATAALCSYWVIPLITGRGGEASKIAAIGSGDLIAFAAVPDRTLGLLPNVLGLYGFWAENTGRFTSMKAFVPGWPVALAALLAIAATGVPYGIRSRDREITSWVVGLVIAASIGLLLEMGVSHPLTAGVVRWLDSTVPLYRGMRDAGKWAALLALVYSQLFGLGTAAILGWIGQLKLPKARAEWAASVAAGLLIALPIYYGNGLLFGMHGEVKPSDYPAGWYSADRTLLADAHPGRTLFLPWHEYLSYSFIKNQNNVVACPAPTFFSVPILSSANPEVPGVAPPSDPDQEAVAGLVADGKAGQWAPVLATLGIKYVLLAKEVDWKSYEYLDSQPDLVLVADYGSIRLYRNERVP